MKTYVVTPDKELTLKIIEKRLEKIEEIHRKTIFTIERAMGDLQTAERYINEIKEYQQILEIEFTLKEKK